MHRIIILLFHTWTLDLLFLFTHIIMVRFVRRRLVLAGATNFPVPLAWTGGFSFLLIETANL